MGWFGKSFDEKVAEAVEKIRSMNLGVESFAATTRGKIVTLSGAAQSMDAKARVMREFNTLVETENTLNEIRVAKPEPPPAAASPAPAAAARTGGSPPAAVAKEGAADRRHEVVRGDTLSALAKKYYGDGRKYMKIFEANRDILDNPDLIKVGQRLRIPE